MPFTGPQPARRAPRSARGGRRDAAERLLPAGRRAPPHPVPRHRRGFRPGLHVPTAATAGRGDPPRRRDAGRLRPARRRLHCRFDAPVTPASAHPARRSPSSGACRRPGPPPPPCRSPGASLPAAVQGLAISPDSQRLVLSAARLVDERSDLERSSSRGRRRRSCSWTRRWSRTATSNDFRIFAPFDAGRLHRRSALRRALLPLLRADARPVHRGRHALPRHPHDRRRRPRPRLHARQRTRRLPHGPRRRPTLRVLGACRRFGRASARIANRVRIRRPIARSISSGTCIPAASG